MSEFCMNLLEKKLNNFLFFELKVINVIYYVIRGKTVLTLKMTTRKKIILKHNVNLIDQVDFLALFIHQPYKSTTLWKTYCCHLWAIKPNE